MAGTIVGGIKARETNRKRYGSDYYRTIGRLGGSISKGGGFAKNPELARQAGRKGGGFAKNPELARQAGRKGGGFAKNPELARQAGRKGGKASRRSA